MDTNSYRLSLTLAHSVSMVTGIAPTEGKGVHIRTHGRYQRDVDLYICMRARACRTCMSMRAPMCVKANVRIELVYLKWIDRFDGGNPMS